MVKKIGILFFLLCTACYKEHLYVQQESVDASYLASSYVRTPDFRQDDPPKGKRIHVSWDFPLSMYEKNLSFLLTVRFQDQHEKEFTHVLDSRRGWKSFYFSDPIETYKLEIISEGGKVEETWKHHFWKNCIKVDSEEDSRLR